MVSIRLHTLRAIVVIIITLSLFCCAKTEEVSDNKMADEYKIYKSDLEVIDNYELANLKYKSLREVFSSREILGFDRSFIYTFDDKLNGYIKRYKVNKEYKNEYSSGKRLYFVDNQLLKNYGDKLFPNTSIAIYKMDQMYISVRKEKNNYYIIYSKDLLDWEKTPLNHFAPILIFRTSTKLYSIIGNEIYDISVPFEHTLINKIDKTIMLPEENRPHSVSDSVINFVFQIDDYLYLKTYRTYETEAFSKILVINLKDFSHKVFDELQELKGNYDLKVIESYIYYIGKEKTLIVNPLSENGPTIIEEIEGINTY